MNVSRLDRLVPLKNKSIVKKTIDGVGCVVVVSVDALLQLNEVVICST